ncbi:chitotriosidase-1-like [Gigantopelta aegis]|uniref:chitotriosidase-1-like n=1 Tax=Gigantopelta aegis TaxID=1735272 RepID=UPI001B88BC19|nr:chitotriosidase-1-like [Gigantopelta aegis]
MFWALDLDDFKQVCTPVSKRKYPLIQAVTDVLGGSPETKEEICNISTETSTCSGRAFGMYPDESDCSKFYICALFGKFRMSCPATFVWNPVIISCSQRSLVNLCFCRDHQQDSLLLARRPITPAVIGQVVSKTVDTENKR